MAMKTSDEQFKERVETNLNDTFMRGAISGLPKPDFKPAVKLAWRN